MRKMAGVAHAAGLILLCLTLSGWSLFGSEPKEAEHKLPANWPPQLNQPYPDITVFDGEGKAHQLSELKGKVIVLKLIGMSCPACNAFSGAQEKGGYDGVKPQAGLESFEKYFYQFAKGASLGDERIAVVNLLLYSPSYKTPTPEEVKAWAKHFSITGKPNHYVFSGGEALATKENMKLIPGFQLIDQAFMLRRDSSGHHPVQDLFRDLLPAIPKLVGK